MYANERSYDALIAAAHQSFPAVPAALIAAVIAHESQFHPTAYRAEPAIGDGSVGLMQVLAGTAAGFGYSGPVGSANDLSGLFDPGTNIYYGTAALNAALAMTEGNIPGAISAYNGGYRPALGFGVPATAPVTVCLVRDANGKCISSRQVAAGEFGNQPYVDDVLAKLSYFSGLWGGGGFPPGAASPPPLPPRTPG